MFTRLGLVELHCLARWSQVHTALTWPNVLQLVLGSRPSFENENLAVRVRLGQTTSNNTRRSTSYASSVAA